jgi:hypothetical protein
MFGLDANHESGDVVEEDDGGVSARVSLLFSEAGLETLLLVAHSNELSSLSSFIRIDNG